MVDKVNTAKRLISGSYVLRTKTGAYNSMIKANLDKMGVTSCMLASSLAYTDVITLKEILEEYPV